MRVIPTSLPDVLVIESPVYSDARGSFTNVFHAKEFAAAGLPVTFAQDSHSRTVQYGLRGMHYQLDAPQGKLVRAITGTVFDVVVDLRRDSPAFAKWVGVTLSAGDGRQLWIPPGFAHGFLVLSEAADMGYKLTRAYDPASERTLAWNDATVGIEWPLPAGVAPILSAKDAAGAYLPEADVYV